jgi:hypothetical protein
MCLRDGGLFRSQPSLGYFWCSLLFDGQRDYTIFLCLTYWNTLSPRLSSGDPSSVTNMPALWIEGNLRVLE